MEQLLPVFGIALIVAALCQFGLWTGRGLRLRRLDKRKFQIELAQLRAEIFSITSQGTEGPIAEGRVKEAAELAVEQAIETPLAEGDWKGYRKFKVERLIKEAERCTSVYLVPADGLPIASYLPGQHLTLKIALPGQAKPLVRCYSLSETPIGKYYRISVKHCLPPTENPDFPEGVASTFINSGLQEGDSIDVKSPRGNFFLREGDTPVILLAGGIGVTPLLSMLNSIACAGSGRECLLVYGVRNSREHAFGEYLKSLARNLSNIHVVNCFSDPLPDDRRGIDYQVKGFASIDLLKHALRGDRYEFYLCGPPPFMQSMYDGLIRWGIPDELIHYEAFGPATIRRQTSESSHDAESATASLEVHLRKSNRKTTWTADHRNLLDLIEEQGIEIESGCRSGNCGTCQTRLLKGEVAYEDADQIECEPGYCLPCVAKPVEAIELDV